MIVQLIDVLAIEMNTLKSIRVNVGKKVLIICRVGFEL